MRRSERLVVVVASGLAVAACNAIAGLGDFQEVACDPPCADATPSFGDDSSFETGAGDDGPGDDGSLPEADALSTGPGGDDSGPDAVSGDDGGDASDAPLDQSSPETGSVDRAWARWLMPNSASGADAGLPNPARYDTSTESVVRDLVTNLVWQATPTTASTLALAQGACAAPWRLPTRIELVSILDVTQSPLTANPAFAFAPVTLWTSSMTPDAHSWLVSFGSGDVAYAPNLTGQAALCVQGPP